VGLGLTLLLSCVAADAADVADQDAAWVELESLSANREPITSYAADFRQEKFTPLLREPIRSNGRVRIAEGDASGDGTSGGASGGVSGGGVSRWDTEAPYASTMLIADGELKLHYPEQQSLEIYALGDRLDALAASPVPDLAVLRKNFEIAGYGWTKGNKLFSLTLLPRSDAMREALEEISVDIDPALGSMRRLSMTDLDGETTVMHFENIELNLKLDPADLALDLPAGTMIVRPMEAVGR